jgi:hypothetical protein
MASIEKLHKRIKVNPENGCWEWQKSVNNSGYGQFRFDGTKGKCRLAHRVSFELYVGDIPDGLCVLHKCHNRLCVNPEHLKLGTRADNAKDMTDAGRQAIGSNVMNTKLSEQNAQEIRELYKTEKWTHRDLAQKFKVSRRTIFQVIHYITFKYVA